MSEAQENKYFIPKDVDSVPTSRRAYNDSERDLKDLNRGFKINNESSDEEIQAFLETRIGLKKELEEMKNKAHGEAIEEDEMREVENEKNIKIDENAQKIFDSWVNTFKSIRQEDIVDYNELDSMYEYIKEMVYDLRQMNTDPSYNTKSAMLNLVDCARSDYGKLADALEVKMANYENKKKIENDNISLNRIRYRIKEM